MSLSAVTASSGSDPTAAVQAKHGAAVAGVQAHCKKTVPVWLVYPNKVSNIQCPQQKLLLDWAEWHVPRCLSICLILYACSAQTMLAICYSSASTEGHACCAQTQKKLTLLLLMPVLQHRQFRIVPRLTSSAVQVPKSLGKYSSAGSRLLEYQCLRDSISSVIVTRPSTVTVKHTKHEGADRSLSLPHRVDTLHKADREAPPRMLPSGTATVFRGGTTIMLVMLYLPWVW